MHRFEGTYFGMGPAESPAEIGEIEIIIDGDFVRERIAIGTHIQVNELVHIEFRAMSTEEFSRMFKRVSEPWRYRAFQYGDITGLHYLIFDLKRRWWQPDLQIIGIRDIMEMPTLLYKRCHWFPIAAIKAYLLYGDLRHGVVARFRRQGKIRAYPDAVEEVYD